jgi:RHS repeat-associated protein
VTLARRYDAWGNLELGATTSGYAFTGREWDPEAGLSYYRARYYDPQIGRFNSEDPMRLGGGDTNFYQYAYLNPVRFGDPMGTIPAVIGPLLGGEYALHQGLALWGLLYEFPPGKPTPDRQRHCWINCVSTRIHLLNPFVPTLFSAAQEGPTFMQTRSFSADFKDDWSANFFGQRNAWMIWKSCHEICEQCPSRRR